MKELFYLISRREWIFVGSVAVIVMVLMAAPYIYGAVTAPEQMVYTGIHHLTPGDTNVFLSMIEQVKQGENIFINLYTSESQERLFINPLWLSVGWFAKLTGTSNLLTLHIVRSFWIVVFMFVVYLFLAYVLKKQRWRKLVLLLVVFSSGLGVFFNPFLFDINNITEHPTDIWVAESITFLTLYHSPHLTASLTLIVLTFLLMLMAFRTNKVRYSVGAGIACLFLLWFHPFNGPTVYFTLFTFLVIVFLQNRKIIWSYIRHCVIMGVIPIPAVAYLYWLNQTDWVIRNWAAQNILMSPSVWMFLIGYGFLVPLAVFGSVRVTKHPSFEKLFIIAWALSSSLLIYFPISFQRRMSEGLHIPLAILTGVAVIYLLKRYQKKDGSLGTKAFVILILLAVFLPLTNIQIVGQDFHLYSSKKELPYYLHQDEVEAMHWLREAATEREVIFSSYYTGNFIPAYSGRIVWIGHGPQTINLIEKRETTDWFWLDDSEDSQKKTFLHDENIRFVYYGQKEKELGTYDPATKKYLSEVFQNGQVAIYSVL